MTPENEKILSTLEMQAWLKEMKARSQAALRRSEELLKNIPKEFLEQLEENKNETK